MQGEERHDSTKPNPQTYLHGVKIATDGYTCFQRGTCKKILLISQNNKHQISIQNRAISLQSINGNCKSSDQYFQIQFFQPLVIQIKIIKHKK